MSKICRVSGDILSLLKLIILLVIILYAFPTFAEDLWYEESISFYKNGYLTAAQNALKKQLTIVKNDQQRLEILDLLLEECLSSYNFTCLQETQSEAWPILNKLGDDQRIKIYKMWYSALGLSYVPKKDLKQIDVPPEILKKISWMNNVDSFHYGRFQIYEGRLLNHLGRYTESYEAVERAKIALFNIPAGNRFYIATYLVDLIQGFVDCGNTLNAFKWLVTSENFIRSTLPINGPDYTRFLILRAGISSNFAPINSLLSIYEEAYNSASKIDYSDISKEYILSELLSEYAIIAALNNDEEKTFYILKNHPLTAKSEDILSGKENTNPIVISYAATTVVINTLFKRPIDERWVKVLEKAKINNEGVKYEDYAEDYTNYIRDYIDFTSAVINSKVDLNVSAKFFASSAKSRIENLKKTRNRYPDSFPLINIWDRILIEFGVLAGIDVRDADLIISGSEVLDRNITSFITDAKSLLAAQSNDTQRLIAKTWLRRHQQRYDWEMSKLSNFLNNSAAGKDINQKEILFDRINYSKNYEAEREQRQAIKGLADKPFLPDLKRIQASMKDGEAFIKVTPVSGRLVRYCVTNKFYTVAPSKFIDQKSFSLGIKILEENLKDSDLPADPRPQSYPLQEAYNLWSTITDDFSDCIENKTQLIFSLPPFLRGIPLEALIYRKPLQNKNLNNQDWVGARWVISYEDSAQSFISSRELNLLSQKAELRYLGIGNPEFKKGSSNILTVRGFKRGAEKIESFDLNELEPLPSTRKEIQDIASAFNQSKFTSKQKSIDDLDGNVKILLGDKATEKSYRNQSISNYHIIHFATHALIREEVPGINEASLVFTPGPSSEKTNDGLLTTTEISSLDLNAGIVILSACNTANLDPQIFGNQLSGLSNAFSFSGVPTVLASLWEINDEATQKLMAAHTKEIHDNPLASIGIIHRASIKNFLSNKNNSKYSHPRYWASIVVLGNSSTPISIARKLAVNEHLLNNSKGEILSSVVDKKIIISSSIVSPDIHTDRHSSIIFAQDDSGSRIWLSENNEIAAGKIYDFNESVLVTGYVGTGKIRPVIRKFDKATGHEFTFSNGQNEIGIPLSLLITKKNIVLMTHDVDYKNLHQYIYNHSGILLSQKSIIVSPPVNYTVHSINAMSSNKLLSLQFNYSSFNYQKSYIDEFGVFGKCHNQFKSEFVFYDSTGNEVDNRINIDGYDFHGITLNQDNSILAVGSKNNNCGPSGNGVVVTINKSGQYKELWSDAYSVSAVKQAFLNNNHLSIIEKIDLPVELYVSSGYSNIDAFLDNFYNGYLVDDGVNITRSVLNIIDYNISDLSENRRLFASGFSDMISGSSFNEERYLIYGNRAGVPRLMSVPKLYQ